MAETDKTRIYEEGNYGFMVQTLKSDGTYEGTPVKIEGLISIDCTMSRTITNTAADDITDYITRVSPETGEGTITFTGLSKDSYKALFNAITDTNGVLVFGKKNNTKKVGVSFFNTQNYAEGSSINKFTLNNVTFSLPNLSTTTIAEDNTTIRSFALSFTANPLNYTDNTGNPDRVTWSLINSVDDSDIWENVKDTIYVPDSVVA